MANRKVGRIVDYYHDDPVAPVVKRRNLGALTSSKEVTLPEQQLPVFLTLHLDHSPSPLIHLPPSPPLFKFSLFRALHTPNL